MLMKAAGVWRQRLDTTDIGEDVGALFTPQEHAKLNALLERYEGDVETRKRVRFVGHTARRMAKKDIATAQDHRWQSHMNTGGYA